MSIEGGFAALYKSIVDGPTPIPASNPSIYIPTFSKFCKLPLEVQFMIWGEAAAEVASTDRIIEISYKANREKKDRKTVLYIPPPLLHACQLSRRSAIKYYQYTDFGRQLEHKIYYNPNADILQFLNTALLTQFVDRPPDGVQGYMNVPDIKVDVYHMEDIDNKLICFELPNRHLQDFPPGLQCIRRIGVGIMLTRSAHWKMQIEFPFLLQAISRMEGLRQLHFKKPVVQEVRRSRLSDTDLLIMRKSQEQIDVYGERVKEYKRFSSGEHWWRYSSSFGSWNIRLLFAMGWKLPEITWGIKGTQKYRLKNRSEV